MALDTKLQATVLNLLKKQGAQVTLRKTAVTVNASRPWNKDSAATSDQTPYAIISQYSAFEQASIEGTKASDLRFFMEASSITTAPEVGDMIVNGSDIYSIVEVGQIAHVPQGAVIAFECRARK